MKKAPRSCERGASAPPEGDVSGGYFGIAGAHGFTAAGTGTAQFVFRCHSQRPSETHTCSVTVSYCAGTYTRHQASPGFASGGIAALSVAGHGGGVGHAGRHEHASPVRPHEVHGFSPRITRP